MKEFENYVAQTVTHYKGRIHDWQVFNEPLHTNYAFDGTRGYKTADYVRYMEAFVARRARTRESARGRIQHRGLSSSARACRACLAELERFIALGGLKHLDVFTLHTYPRSQPPEGSSRSVRRLNAVMDEHGCRRPIWFTEYAYYADDEPWCKPINVHRQRGPAAQRTSVQAEYQVRMERHAVGQRRGEDLYPRRHRLGGQPRQLVDDILALRQRAVQVLRLAGRDGAVAHAGAASSSSGSCPANRSRRTCSATASGRWRWSGRRPARSPSAIRLTDAKLQLWDIVGRPQAARTFTPSESPVYIVGDGVSPEELEKGLVP